MLLNSVVLILREVLEAAMLVSVLLALSLNLRSGVRWFWWSLSVGVFGAVLFSFNLDLITDALDGAGQEVANVAMQVLVYCFALGIIWFSIGIDRSRTQARALTTFMACAIASAMIWEGSEILVYITGFTVDKEHRAAVFAGSAIGAGIGISLGVLMFSALRALNKKLAGGICLALLCLIGSGMILQSAKLLEQVDWLPAGQALWDSSALIGEQSIAGILLYAVFGYESTPSGTQVVLYVASLLIAVAAYLLARSLKNPVHVD